MRKEKETFLTLFSLVKAKKGVPMKGPYRVEWLDHYLQEQLPGVFLCSNDGEFVLEIGWSDKDLKEAIKKTCTNIRGIDNNYSYFWFQYAQNPKEAFYLYCREWHKYKWNTDSAKHPKPPPEFPDPECPICGCEWRKEEMEEGTNF